MSGNVDYCAPFIKFKAQLYNFLLAGSFDSFINKMLGKTRGGFYVRAWCYNFIYQSQL